MRELNFDDARRNSSQSKPTSAQHLAEAAWRAALAPLTDEEREELEDEFDMVTANRAREEDRANPSARKTLDNLRCAHLRQISATLP